MLLIQLILLLVVLVGILVFAFRKGMPAQESSDAGRAHGAGERSAALSLEGLPEPQEAESFPFDPNTADSTTLLRLGLTRSQVRNIYRYRARNGVFHRPEDFKKLYGLTAGQWHHLQPLIRIGEAYRYLSDTQEAYDPAVDGYGARGGRAQRQRGEGYEEETERESVPYGGAGRDTTLFPHKLQQGQTIDLNLADTTQLKRVPGIGTVRARRIVEYRQRLGGFVSLQQLDDLPDVPLDIEPYLTLAPGHVRKVRINRAGQRELNNHPYINYYQSRVIVNHIRQIGPIHSLDELEAYEEFQRSDIQRLSPYVDYSE